LIYFIQAGKNGPIKIGYTDNDISTRLSQLQTGCPDEIKPLGVYVGDEFEESYLHKIFSHHNIRGEWFQPAKSILDFIKIHCKNPKLVNIPKPKPTQSKSDYKKLPKNRYTEIPAPWWMKLEKYLIGGQARQCLMLIIIQTCGWKRKEVKLSLDDFYRKTNIGKTSIVRALKSLRDKKIINVKKISGQKYPAYSFNDNFNQWEKQVKKLWHR